MHTLLRQTMVMHNEKQHISVGEGYEHLDLLVSLDYVSVVFVRTTEVQAVIAIHVAVLRPGLDDEVLT